MSVSRRSFLVGGVLGAAALGTSLALLGQQLSGGVRPQAAGRRPVREACSYGFSQGWLFGGRYVTGAEQPGYDDGGFEKVVLPHTVTGLSWDNWDYASWEGVWIYRKHFAGTAVTGGRVLVTFDGVMTDAVVVLNGWTAGAHAGGYLPWTTELTSRVTEGDNVLAVIVDARWLDVPPDAGPSGPSSVDYLQPGGIYRDVTLHVVPEIYLEDVFARPQNVLSAGRDVMVQAAVNAAVVPEGNTATITAALLDGTRVLAAATTTAGITGTGTSIVSLTIGEIGPVTYWSPENPELYTVQTTLSYGRADGQGGAHTVTTTIGFREAVFTEGGFYLNGGRYAIFGLNRHQMFPYLGMAAGARLQRRDAQIVKNELNCNMVRCSHYPQSPHFLDACDELGIMVWEEPPGWVHMGDAAFQARMLRDVRDMVARDRNRPSVVVWGTRLGETRNYPALYAQARQVAYACDGSRQTAGAVASHRRPAGPRTSSPTTTTTSWTANPNCSRRSRRPVSSQRIGRRAEPYLPVARPAFGARQPGLRARLGPRPSPVRHPVRRAPGLGGLRLLLGRAEPQELEHAAHAGGRRHLPGAQARRGHLPVAGRSRHQSGDRAGVLLGFPLSAGGARARTACSPPTATGWRSLQAARTWRPRRRTVPGSATWPTRPPSPASPWAAAPSRTSG